MFDVQYSVGRSETSDYVIDHALVSRIHAYVEDRQGRFFLVDNNSSNCSYVNSLETPIQEAEIHLDDIVFLSRQFSIPARLLIDRLVSGRKSTGGLQIETHETVVSIGRDPANDIVVPSLRVALFQAQIQVLPDGTRAAIDIGNQPVMYVNGHQVGKTAVLINPGDDLELAGTKISLDFQVGDSLTRLAATRQGVYLKAQGIDWDVGTANKPLRILDDIFIAGFPGEIIGLLGPSGSGKTSLLDILCGTRPPTNGSVRLDGIALEDHRKQLLPLIGYVPQDDLLFAELTIREALFYYAKLRLPKSTEPAAINARIEELCGQLGLSERIDTIIGAPGNKTLSGGQRKRVNIALELLTDPLILFLDEPTSGLSSRDARVVMELLRNIAREMGVCVVVTIHQPSMRVYSLLDYTTYLKDGRLCFFGTAVPDSIVYFEPNIDPYVAGPDSIMERLEETEASTLQQQFLQNPKGSSLASERLSRAAVLDHDSPQQQESLGRASLFQWMILTRRYFLRIFRSHIDLAVMGTQALVIGSLLGLAFIDQYPLNTPIFLLSFVAIWLSTNNSAREIVSERTVFARERRGGVSPGSYFMALVTGQMTIAIAQNIAILLLALNIAGLGTPLLPALLVCCCAAFVGIMVGLLISTVSKTEVAALIAVPLVLVPFILVGGVMISYDNMPAPFQLLAEVTPSKWAYEALLALENIAFNDLSTAIQAEAAKDAKAMGTPLPISPFSSAYADADNAKFLNSALLGSGVLLLQGAFWGFLTYLHIRSSR
ncbi:MAG: ATP-binding cassette domain-containing protein [Pseudomonadales bacterium]